MNFTTMLKLFVCLAFMMLFPGCKEQVTQGETKKGTIIFLHGISSAGKTSIAKKLQNILAEPYLYLGIDTFTSMLPEQLFNFDPTTYQTTEKAKEEGVTFEPLTVNGQQRLVVRTGSYAKKVGLILPEIFSLFAQHGINSIIDFAFAGADLSLAEDFLKKFVKDLHNYKIYFINLTVSAEIAAQREQARSGFKGLAAGQQYSLLKSLTPESFDLEIDTSNLSSEQVAQNIIAFMKIHEHPQAFEKLYKQYFH